MPQNNTPLPPSSQTPAKRAVAELASRRRRFASMLYEFVLLAGILAAAFLLPWMLLTSHLKLPRSSAWVGTLELLHIFVLLGTYFIYCWHRHGQTLAMQTWRLSVVTAEGHPLSWQRAGLRYTLAWPSVLCCGIGLIWSFIDLDNLFLHDRLAGTRLVQLKKEKVASGGLRTHENSL